MIKLCGGLTRYICTGLLLISCNSAWSAELQRAADGWGHVVAVASNQESQAQKTTSSGNSSTEATELAAHTNNRAQAVNRDGIGSLPNLDQPVIDQANLLSPAEKQRISQQILQLYQQGQAQIGVLIVATTGEEDIFSFSMHVAEQWQLGSAQRDNGLLMVIAVNDHRIQILTGYGLEGVLPDIVVGRIIRNQITPYFKQNQYAQGIEAGLNEIERILNLDPEIAQQAAQELKQQQERALQQQHAQQKTWGTALFILIAGVIGSYIVGKRLSAATAGVAAIAAGMVNGLGIFTSLLLGAGIFILLISSIAQLLFQLFLSSTGRGGGRGGFGGGGGYRGGGGGFGGGGASGSW